MCASQVAPNPGFLPDTPAWDIAAAITGGFALILLLIAAGVLSQIPFASNGPGTAGVAFYFVFIPVTAAGLLFLVVFVLVWSLRRDARRPRQVI